MMLFRRLILTGLLRSTSTTSAFSPKPVNVCNGERFLSSSCYCDSTRHQTSGGAGSTAKDMLDPFALIKDEVSEITYRLRSMVVSEVPELTSAAGYFFRAGAEGKRTCPTVLLLMASALRIDTPESIIGSKNELRARHMRVAEITEMIHVASLIHDDVLDVADTRRGMDSLNSAVGNKALEYLAKSRGIERTKLLATEHAKLAADAVDALPEVEDRVALISRQALKDLAQKLIRRTK